MVMTQQGIAARPIPLHENLLLHPIKSPKHSTDTIMPGHSTVTELPGQSHFTQKNQPIKVLRSIMFMARHPYLTNIFAVIEKLL